MLRGQCQHGKQTERAYRYADTAMLGEGAEFRLFLKAIAEGVIYYYDPGIKLENASNLGSKHKLRSQIRISSRRLPEIYRSTRVVSVDRTT